MVKTQGFTGNQVYRPYALQGVVIKYHLKCTIILFYKNSKNSIWMKWLKCYIQAFKKKVLGSSQACRDTDHLRSFGTKACFRELPELLIVRRSIRNALGNVLFYPFYGHCLANWQEIFLSKYLCFTGIICL